jgi:predicted phosphate transport protein (TIGR00153 family)
MITIGKNKEKKVVVLIRQHIEKVQETLEYLHKTIKAYIDEDMDNARDISFKVHCSESEADNKRRDIIQTLHEGAFLPIYREGLINIVAMIDKIADHSESSSDFLITQRPEIPDEFRDSILELTEDSVKCFNPLREAIDNLFSDTKVLRQKVKEVNNLEAEVDRDEWKTTERVFNSSMDLAKKIHLREFIWHIASISDTCQDAADSLEIITAKKAF